MKLYQMNGGANWPQVQDARSIFSRVQSIKSQFDKWCHKTSNGLSLCVCPFNLSYFAPAAVVRRKGVWETLYLRAQIDFGLCELLVATYECCFYTNSLWNIVLRFWLQKLRSVAFFHPFSFQKFGGISPTKLLTWEIKTYDIMFLRG